jgi:hypothetical protein
MQRKVHYVGVLPKERGRIIILSKDRRVRQKQESFREAQKTLEEGICCRRDQASL